MQPLERTLRSQLERSLRQARRVGEQAARAALDALGVADASVPPHLDEEQRVLRRRLRAHARSLGDTFRNGGSVPERLIAEVAYEHWHRMLFARFLAENDLLMYDGVAITLEECAELAAEEGGGSGWELAARLAAKLLPQVFRIDSPVFALRLAPDDQRALEGLLAGLAAEVFQASDSLGWVYQFWQADAKERINQSEVKIGARELPAVTQLFTEPYMVSFLLDNSLGAWWAARRLSETDLRSASNEEDLRRKAAIPGVPLDYLRFVQQEDGTWTPAAGTFDGWPEQLTELKILDPCCGSGHFLVAAFLMLVAMRMERDGLSPREAVDAVLRQNIHGLELDKRCVELAAFALALTAWKYPSAGGYRVLPDLNVACSGLSISAKKEDWLALAGNNTNLRIALEEIYNQFKDAPVLGSLINPEASLGKSSLFELKWEEIGPLLSRALAGEKDDEKTEMAVVAKGLSKTAAITGDSFNLVSTNVPFLTAIKYSDPLKKYIEGTYQSAKANLATAMALRSIELLEKDGVACYVAPQSWMFLKGYRHFRRKLMTEHSIALVARLGEQGFQSSQSNGEQVALNIIYQSRFNERNIFWGLDVSDEKDVTQKSVGLTNKELNQVEISKQLSKPQHIISFSMSVAAKPLSEFASALRGCGTGDAPGFVRNFWEIQCFGHDWAFHQTTPKGVELFDGMSEIILWENEAGKLAQLAESVRHLNHAAQNWRRGKPNWGKAGVIVSQMGNFPASIYAGAIYDPNCCAIVPFNPENTIALWAYCYGGEFTTEVKHLNQNRKVEVKTFLAAPFDEAILIRNGKQLYPKGLPKPYADDPTQWIFHGHPCGSVIWDEDQKWTAHGPLRNDEAVLQIAVARLLGYRWPAELDPAMDLADEQREWVRRCEMLLPVSDSDGIVCIPPVRGETRAEERVINLLAAAYGDAWSANMLSRLLASADHAGKSLESWLRDKFFAQHCRLFQQRPFIWQIWDGLRDGFSVLVNYHKLDRKNLETLIYTYIGDWIRNQRDDLARAVDGAQEKLDAAEALQRRLEQILEGEAPYDIFVRWKPIEEQPIGWNPDLNDGVRLNIRPFLTVDDVARKGAGILRDKPNIHWKNDRGKDVTSAPWYKLFKGDRINDHHLTLADKKASREQHENHNKP